MNAKTPSTLSIEADPNVPLIRITREFDAPPSKVFSAHTNPELVVQWLGPRDMTITIDHYNCRTGGSYRYVHTRPGFEAAFRGTFHEVRPDSMIVQTFTWEAMPDYVSLERLSLEDIGNNRTRMVATSLVDSFESRDAMVASGMDEGLQQSYERLDNVLSSVM